LSGFRARSLDRPAAEQNAGIPDYDRRRLDGADHRAPVAPSGSITTAPIASANSPTLRQCLK
jgi:hypothetical protein